jgi:hypothetical protein
MTSYLRFRFTGPCSANGQPADGTSSENPTKVGVDVPDFAPPTGEVPPPTTIPAGLPCAGQAITQLSPAQLHMVVGKVRLRQMADPSLTPLLEAMESERQARLDRGRKKNPLTGGLPHGGLAPEGNGDGA